jgi:hypothetical protein
MAHTIILIVLLDAGLIAALVVLLLHYGVNKDRDHRYRLLRWHREGGERAHRRQAAWPSGSR